MDPVPGFRWGPRSLSIEALIAAIRLLARDVDATLQALRSAAACARDAIAAEAASVDEENDGATLIAAVDAAEATKAAALEAEGVAADAALDLSLRVAEAAAHGALYASLAADLEAALVELPTSPVEPALLDFNPYRTHPHLHATQLLSSGAPSLRHLGSVRVLQAVTAAAVEPLELPSRIRPNAPLSFRLRLREAYTPVTAAAVAAAATAAAGGFEDFRAALTLLAAHVHVDVVALTETGSDAAEAEVLARAPPPLQCCCLRTLLHPAMRTLTVEVRPSSPHDSPSCSSSSSSSSSNGWPVGSTLILRSVRVAGRLLLPRTVSAAAPPLTPPYPCRIPVVAFGLAADLQIPLPNPSSASEAALAISRDGQLYLIDGKAPGVAVFSSTGQPLPPLELGETVGVGDGSAPPPQVPRETCLAYCRERDALYCGSSAGPQRSRAPPIGRHRRCGVLL
jgi:hypothetical protein